MSMSELTDDQLDGLFRKSAEEFDPPFDPVAWRDMKTRLDANDRTVGSPIWKNLLRWGLPIVLLLLLSGGGWYIYRQAYPVVDKPNVAPTLSQKANQPQPAPETPIADTEPVRTTTVGSKESDAGAGKQSTDLVASVAEPASPESRSDKPTNRPEVNTASKSAIATKRPGLAYRRTTERNRTYRSRLVRSGASTDKSATVTTRYRRGRTASQTSGSTRKQRNTTGNYPTAAFMARNDATLPASASRSTKQRGRDSRELTQINTVDAAGSTTPLVASKTALSVTLPTVSELTIRPAKWPTLAFSDRAVAMKPDTTGRRVIPKPASERGFSVRFAVAPDLTTIGLKNFSRPGTNVGLLLEYRLAPRWIVQAGVIQSTKVYRALPSDYSASYEDLRGYVKPLSIDGQCNMLDIPINLRYDFVLRPRSDGKLLSRWFVSGGVTSYIMNQERYIYNYPPHTYRQNTGKDTLTGGYGFSNLNLSVGYERALSRRLSVQAEPFMKVPLRGVGYFNVKLLSTGAFFSIRYKLSK